MANARTAAMRVRPARRRAATDAGQSCRLVPISALPRILA